jgi:hypothetical protein
MKKSIAVIAVSIVAFAGSAGVAKADYPPIEEVKPSTIIPTISYDRTPDSIDDAARRVFATVPVGTVKTVVGYTDESFTPVIPGVGAGQKFSVRITTASGKTLSLPNVRSIGNGNLRLPTMSISEAGVYTVKVTSSNGKVRTLRIRISN